jgi:L-threonylcarbamoyladenylate synthase
MLIYRPGAITAAMLEPIAGPVTLYQPPSQSIGSPESLPSPGVGIRHYAPRARLILVANQVELNARLTQLLAGKTTKPRVGVMLPQGWTIPHPAEIFSWDSFDDNAALAQSLFSGLRELDRRGVSIILCPRPPAEGLGLAILDRLQKASK